MRHLNHFFLLGLILSQSSMANEANGLSNTKVTVFTSANYLLNNPHYADKIYYLDAVEQIEDKFSRSLSSDLTRAEQEAKSLLASPVGKQFQQELEKAYQGVTEGWTKGIMKIPAVLFETGSESSVVYGETDIASAVQRYRSNKTINY